MKISVQSWAGEGELGSLPPGEDGTAATIAAMQAAVDDALTDPVSARLLEQFETRRMPRDPELNVGQRVFFMLKPAFKFFRDPEGVELLRTPSYLALQTLFLTPGSGRVGADCDDLAMLGAALLARAGKKPVLVTVGRRQGGRFEHVLFGIQERGRVMYLDPQETELPGLMPYNVKKVRVWSMKPEKPRGVE